MKHILASVRAHVCWRPGPAGLLTVPRRGVDWRLGRWRQGPGALRGADPTQLLPDGVDDLLLDFVELSDHLLEDLLFHPV